MDKRKETPKNKPQTSKVASEPPPAPPVAPPVAASNSLTNDIDQLIADIQEDLTAAREAGKQLRADKFYGRLLQAQRIRGGLLGDMRKLELRLAESPEWRDLSAKLAKMVAKCDRCRPAVLVLLDDAS